MYSLKTFLSEIRKIKDSGNLISFMSDGKINDALSEESIIDVSSIEVKVFVDGKEHTITYKGEVNIISLSELLETIKNKLLNRQVKEFLNEDLTNINNELLLLKKKYISFFSQDKLADSYKYIVNITTEDKKKKATVIELNPSDGVELDFDRGDRGFNSLEEAEVYANTFTL